MNSVQINTVISEIISNHFSVDPAIIKTDTNITEDLGADSLDAVEILMEIEDKTGVTIPDSDVLELKTIGNISDYILNASKIKGLNFVSGTADT